MTEILLDAGCNINVYNNRGLTPLYMAIYNADLEIVKLLVKYGASLSATKIMDYCGEISAKKVVEDAISITEMFCNTSCHLINNKNYEIRLEKLKEIYNFVTKVCEEKEKLFKNSS